MSRVRYHLNENGGIDTYHYLRVHSISGSEIRGHCRDIYEELDILYKKWLVTDPKGRFIHENATDIRTETVLDPHTYNHIFLVAAELGGKKLTEFYLRFDKNK